MTLKKSILSFLGQLIPVMIGVYLGFALNNFGEERKTRKQLKSYEEMLLTEIKDNIQQIASVRDYHTKVGEEIRSLQQSDDIISDYDHFTTNEFSGIRPAIVNSSAYETGIQTGMIQEFDLDVVREINRTYTMQQIYTDFTLSMVQSFSSKQLPETEKEILASLRMMEMNFNDIHSLESLLEKYYGELSLMIQ